MRLITGHYKTGKARQREMRQCLINNIKNPFITEIVLILEDVNCSLKHPKLKVVRATTRSKVSDLISNFKGISILANCDVYFDNTLELVNLMKDDAFAISRINVTSGGNKPFFLSYSQDCWIFDNYKFKGGDYLFGIRGTDNRLAHELIESGYNTSNPCKSINVFHLHESNERNYDQSSPEVGQPYAYLEPISI